MESPIKVNMEASAKAELSLKGEIPSKSVGRLLDAVTDVFRPFTESRGLKADQIKLQREDVAIEIAKRARARLAIEEMQPNPVDTKILIPLIEKSSLEKISDSDMLDRWSSLLAKATTLEKVQPRYVQILSELSSRQASLFEKVMLNDPKFYPYPDRHFLDAPEIYSSPRIREEIHEHLLHRKSRINIDDLADFVEKILDGPGCVILETLVFAPRPSDTMVSLKIDEYWLDRHSEIELDLEIIESLGLVRKVSLFTSTKFREDLQLFYYHATELGVNFFKSVDRRQHISSATGNGKTEEDMNAR